jgi:thiamine-phosphate pyrophosphorylase
VSPPSLIALTPGDLDDARALQVVRVLEPCARAGLRGVLLREPLLSDRVTLDLARELRRLFADAWLGLHDRVHLAEECGADAVQLGFKSLAPAVARRVLAADVAIGFSAHAGDDDSAWIDCDHLLFGPVFDTPSKRGLQEPVGLDGLARATRRTKLPLWAIGGLQPAHAAGVLASGAAGMAVLGGIVRAPLPADACAQYLDALCAAGRA